MNRLEIQQTYKSPMVIFDPSNEIYEVSGHSIPENALTCYAPIFNWIDSNIDNIETDKMEINFKLDYMNSSSARMLIMLFNKLEDFSNKGKKIEINWYHEDNEDDLDIAKLYKSATNLPFNLISVNEDFTEISFVN